MRKLNSPTIWLSVIFLTPSVSNSQLFALAGSEGTIGENKRRQMKEKQDELEIEKAKEALLKKQRPLEVSVFNIFAWQRSTCHSVITSGIFGGS